MDVPCTQNGWDEKKRMNHHPREVPGVPIWTKREPTRKKTCQFEVRINQYRCARIKLLMFPSRSTIRPRSFVKGTSIDVHTFKFRFSLQSANENLRTQSAAKFRSTLETKGTVKFRSTLETKGK
jgi:hypothetical protein